MSTPAVVWLRFWPNGAISVHEDARECTVRYERAAERATPPASIAPPRTPAPPPWDCPSKCGADLLHHWISLDGVLSCPTLEEQAAFCNADPS